MLRYFCCLPKVFDADIEEEEESDSEEEIVEKVLE